MRQPQINALCDRTALLTLKLLVVNEITVVTLRCVSYLLR